MERAVFGTREGEIIVGYGPFEAREEPPSAGVAFYRNDFFLSNQRPWLIPERVERWEGDCRTARKLDWVDPDAGDFAKVFREVGEAIEKRVIEKSVPVAVATAEGDVDVEALLGALGRLPREMRAYGWIGDEEGFVGATPEVLFRFFDGRIDTMALAGTARGEELRLFAADEKEIREHEFVAETLISKLADLGMVRRGERGILELGKLIHFETKIHVELYRNYGVDFLIERLHPTPALGPLPRTEETMEMLRGWRERLGCPGEFGAPFGLWRDGEFEILVGIRMLAWSGKELKLPSGCGVIEESRLVNEWRELELKRDSVRGIFGV